KSITDNNYFLGNKMGLSAGDSKPQNALVRGTRAWHPICSRCYYIISKRLKSTPLSTDYSTCFALIHTRESDQNALEQTYSTTGMETLRRVIAAVPRDIPVILDAKRGDIGSTAAAYAHAAFEVLGAHAITLNPYLGGDALAPFLRYADKGCLLVCKTSNPGGAEVQDLQLVGGGPLYLEIARRAQNTWNRQGNVGLVVGATHPDVLPAVRDLCPDLPLLVPG